jgi:CRP/FNR family transcriptional regulator, cyclic AMP receptor protein
MQESMTPNTRGRLDRSLFLADLAARDHSYGNSGRVAMQDARIELLQRMPVFGGVRADILQFLLGLCPVVSVRANEYFFHEHDQADSMFVIEVGKVAVLKSWRGQEYLLGILKEGDCFGEMAVMDLGPRSASVRAVEDCTAIRLSAANLYRVYEQDPKQFALIQMNMGREVTRRLREADNRLFDMMGPDADMSKITWPAGDARGHRPRPGAGRLS